MISRSIRFFCGALILVGTTGVAFAAGSDQKSVAAPVKGKVVATQPTATAKPTPSSSATAAPKPTSGSATNSSSSSTTPSISSKTRPLTAAAPNAGEQIKWQVISGGGSKGTSTSYVLTGTVGQTAAGPTSSTNYKVNQGFWQSFSCCVGKRGNVNLIGIIDSADLASLVSYLTGGGFSIPCYDAANVNGSGIVDSADLAALVSYLTGGGFVPPNCP
jgi:hypothetical protein